jgi:hypothetical protein
MSIESHPKYAVKVLLVFLQLSVIDNASNMLDLFPLLSVTHSWKWNESKSKFVQRTWWHLLFLVIGKWVKNASNILARPISNLSKSFSPSCCSSIIDQDMMYFVNVQFDVNLLTILDLSLVKGHCLANALHEYFFFDFYLRLKRWQCEFNCRCWIFISTKYEHPTRSLDYISCQIALVHDDNQSNSADSVSDIFNFAYVCVMILRSDLYTSTVLLFRS